MNTGAITDAAIRLSKLTPNEHLIASELAQRLRMGGKPAAPTETQRPAERDGKRWTDDEILLLMQFDEETAGLSGERLRRKRRAFARSIKRPDSAVYKKLWDMRNKRNAQ